MTLPYSLNSVLRSSQIRNSVVVLDVFCSEEITKPLPDKQVPHI